MRLDLHHIHYPDKETAERLCRIERMLGTIRQHQEDIMPTLEDIQAQQADTDALVATLKIDMETLLAKVAAIPPAGLTAEQQAAIDDIAAHGAKINASLSAVDAEAKA